jgi:hypothetical protein
VESSKRERDEAIGERYMLQREVTVLKSPRAPPPARPDSAMRQWGEVQAAQVRRLVVWSKAWRISLLTGGGAAVIAGYQGAGAGADRGQGQAR